MEYEKQTDAPQRLATAIRHYVRNRRSTYPISISEMVRRSQYALPGLNISENELADLIAREIITLGGNVSFDWRPAQDAASREIRA
ncbi:hypothetical protein [Chelativorans sp. AA-79]|uniref:hypothetical protein n=1 Tax=Chelativorans sp. AA-79 TaxID=3028735 RepID=UPI0023F9F9DC|nr:hypothetical protein [Chelativorans sp. AA-79]WEX08280.1 hypothetical protein PVE73_19695 [Chelativorans sp. AA-79]